MKFLALFVRNMTVFKLLYHKSNWCNIELYSCATIVLTVVDLSKRENKVDKY